MQAGGSLQRASTGSPSPQHSKVVSDSAHSSTRHSPAKCKKRERPDHHTSQSKRDHSLKIDESDSSRPKRERLAKVDELIAVTDKDGGLANSSAVNQLILFMQQEHNDVSRKSVDIVSQRNTLVGIIVATEREDCQKHFIQLGGLAILDDWLQEGHKGKAGDGSLREVEKFIDELTLIILRALEKLPIDLEALKACSIGKAVNQLRSHRNLEVQKRARKLKDTWKKMVDLEWKLKGELSGVSGQAIGCCHKDSTSDSAHLYHTKVEEVTETVKASAASNNITISIDSTMTSGTASSTSFTTNGSIRESSTGVRLNGTPRTSPVKEESNSIACQCSSNGSTIVGSPTRREDDKNCAANTNGTSSSLSEDLIGKSIIDVGLTESQNLIAGKSLVWGRSLKDCNSSGHENGIADFGAKERTNDHRKMNRLADPIGNLVCSIDTGLDAETAQGHGSCSRGNMERQACLSADDETSMANEVTGEQRQHSWGKLATDSQVECNATAVNVVEVDRRIENFNHLVPVVQEAPSMKDSGVENQQKSMTDGLAKDKASENREDNSPQVGMSARNRLLAVSAGNDRESGSFLNAGAATSEHPKSMGHVKDEAPKKEKCTKCSTECEQFCHLEMQGTDEGRSSGDSETSAKGKLPQECHSTLSGCTEVSSWQAPKSRSMEGEAANPNDTTAEKSSGLNDLGDEGAKQVQCSETLQAYLPTETAPEFLGEDALEVGQRVSKDAEQEAGKYEKPSCSDITDKQADNARSAGFQDLSSSTIDTTIKNADPCNEGALLTSSEAPVDAYQGITTDGKNCRNALSCDGRGRNSGNLKSEISNSVADNCRKDNEIGQNSDASQFLKGNMDTCGTALSKPSLEAPSGVTWVIESTGSQQPGNAMVLGNTPQLQHDFDLNQGLAVDESLRDGVASCVTAFASASAPVITTGTAPTNMRGLTAPIAVVTATKGGFILPVNSSPNKSEVGWKGSAATSAFRPAEPRRLPERMQVITDTKLSSSTVDTTKQVRNVLDFDLNVVDQGASEDEVGISLITEDQDCSLPDPAAWQFASTSSRRLPHPDHKVDIADLDLNRVEEDGEREVPTTSVSGVAMDSSEVTITVSERPHKNSTRSAMLDFDLNEGPLEEAGHESALPISAIRSSTDVLTPASVVGLSMAGRAGDLVPWSSTGGSFPVVTLPGLNMTRAEPSFSGAMAQPIFGSRQGSLPVGPNLPPSSAVIYPPTAPAFFGCASIPFPPNFSFNPLSFAPDSSPYTITTLGTGTASAVSCQATGQRAMTPLVRPPFVMNITELGGANGIYTWGRPDLNLNASTGSTIINCRDNGKEHLVYHGGGVSLEEHMRFIQQAAVPVTSLKRKEPECGWEQTRTGFRQSTWH